MVQLILFQIFRAVANFIEKMRFFKISYLSRKWCESQLRHCVNFITIKFSYNDFYDSDFF